MIVLKKLHINISKRINVYNNVLVIMLNHKTQIIRYAMIFVNIIKMENINSVWIHVQETIHSQLIYQIFKEIIVYQIVQLILTDII